MKVREHRGGLDASMATVAEIQPTFAALATFFSERHNARYLVEQIAAKAYGYDNRINWDTHIVTIDGQAVGFTDQMPVDPGELPVQDKSFGVSDKLRFNSELGLHVPTSTLLFKKGLHQSLTEAARETSGFKDPCDQLKVEDFYDYLRTQFTDVASAKVFMQKWNLDWDQEFKGTEYQSMTQRELAYHVCYVLEGAASSVELYFACLSR